MRHGRPATSVNEFAAQQSVRRFVVVSPNSSVFCVVVVEQPTAPVVPTSRCSMITFFPVRSRSGITDRAADAGPTAAPTGPPTAAPAAPPAAAPAAAPRFQRAPDPEEPDPEEQGPKPCMKVSDQRAFGFLLIRSFSARHVIAPPPAALVSNLQDANPFQLGRRATPTARPAPRLEPFHVARWGAMPQRQAAEQTLLTASVRPSTQTVSAWACNFVFSADMKPSYDSFVAL